MLYGQKYLPISRSIEQFYVDAAAGQLPSYSYLDPGFGGEGQGTSNDDHPHADIRRGQALVGQVVHALMASPQWSRTLFVLTYDEWGGFFDHVRPPRFPDDVTDTTPGAPNDHGQAGFRVPTVLFGPYARRGCVGHNAYDHSSILKMVEWRFGLPALTKRDAAARNLAETLQFSRPDFSVPSLPTPLDPGPHVCGTPSVGTLPGGAAAAAASPRTLVRGGTPMGREDPFWAELKASPLMRGWDRVTG